MLRIDASRFGAELVEELKGLFEAYPGGTEVALEMTTREGVTAAALRRASTAWTRTTGCARSWISCSDRRLLPPNTRR